MASDLLSNIHYWGWQLIIVAAAITLPNGLTVAALVAVNAIGDVVGQTGQRGVIRVRTYLEGSVVVVAISDTGTGIPEAVRGRIFDPFFTTKEVGKGTGQGLALARAVVVDQHGGSLTFETEMGKGTTFFVRIPFDFSEVQD